MGKILTVYENQHFPKHNKIFLPTPEMTVTEFFQEAVTSFNSWEPKLPELPEKEVLSEGEMRRRQYYVSIGLKDRGEVVTHVPARASKRKASKAAKNKRSKNKRKPSAQKAKKHNWFREPECR